MAVGGEAMTKPTNETPLTVAEALKELRDLLGPKTIFELQIACDMFGNTFYRLVAFTLGTMITGSLDDCIAQVRAWKESQTK